MKPLAASTTDALGTTAINGGSVATSGHQTYGDAVQLGADTVFATSVGDVTFSNTVSGAGKLTVNAAGTATFHGGNLGGQLAVNSGAVLFGSGTLAVGTDADITATTTDSEHRQCQADGGPTRRFQRGGDPTGEPIRR